MVQRGIKIWKLKQPADIFLPDWLDFQYGKFALLGII